VESCISGGSPTLSPESLVISTSHSSFTAQLVHTEVVCSFGPSSAEPPRTHVISSGGGSSAKPFSGSVRSLGTSVAESASTPACAASGSSSPGPVVAEVAANAKAGAGATNAGPAEPAQSRSRRHSVVARSGGIAVVAGDGAKVVGRGGWTGRRHSLPTALPTAPLRERDGTRRAMPWGGVGVGMPITAIVMTQKI